MLNHNCFVKYFIFSLVLCPIYPKYYDNSISHSLSNKYNLLDAQCQSTLHIQIENQLKASPQLNNLPKKIKPKEIIID